MLASALIQKGKCSQLCTCLRRPANTRPVPCCAAPPQVEHGAFASLFLARAGGEGASYGRLVGGLMRAAAHARDPLQPSSAAAGHKASASASSKATAAAEPAESAISGQAVMIEGQARQHAAPLAPLCTNVLQPAGAPPPGRAGAGLCKQQQHTHNSSSAAAAIPEPMSPQASPAPGTAPPAVANIQRQPSRLRRFTSWKR